MLYDYEVFWALSMRLTIFINRTFKLTKADLKDLLIGVYQILIIIKLNYRIKKIYISKFEGGIFHKEYNALTN